ncbi:MAG: AMP-binding protein [Candidatus Binatia bacterium]
MPTIAELILAQAENDSTALLFEDQRWTYREYVRACIARAYLLLEQRVDGPFHIGVLLDNIPEFPMLLGAAALAGAALVGVNPTRRGAQLERDIRHAGCQLLITEASHQAELNGLALPMPPARRFLVDSVPWRDAARAHVGKPPPPVTVDPLAPYLLLFTSGTTGEPKAAICSQARLATIAMLTSQGPGIELGPGDVTYEVMPLFHSNALMAGWSATLAAGAAMVLRRKFSASGFLPDIRRYGCTYMNYVGKPLSYILATPEKPDDADNPLRRCFGNEATPGDIQRFAERFGCTVTDAYGSTEGGVIIVKTPDTPANALGVGHAGTLVLNPVSGEECPPARFDADGILVNADEAVGEIANTQTVATFEGYWNNPEANEERTHKGIYWSGDLGYRDANGFIYFGGRNYDWLRVDGENFAAAPVESILARHPDVILAAVYAVPNAIVGDDVMAAVLLREGSEFDPEEFRNFLAVQKDLGTKWAPRYVRVSRQFPVTPTNKVLKRSLRAEIWECDDPVWRRQADGAYRLMTAADVAEVRKEFAARGRTNVLELETRRA